MYKLNNEINYTKRMYEIKFYSIVKGNDPKIPINYLIS